MIPTLNEISQPRPMPETLGTAIVSIATQTAKPTVPKRPAPTLWDRVWDCLGRGDFSPVQPDDHGDFVIYLKWGVPAYRLDLEDGWPVRCACMDAGRHADTPGYLCKHSLARLVEWGLARPCAVAGCGGVLVGRVVWHEAAPGHRHGHFTCCWRCVCCGNEEGMR
jgi:hypothetical protein